MYLRNNKVYLWCGTHQFTSRCYTHNNICALTKINRRRPSSLRRHSSCLSFACTFYIAADDDGGDGGGGGGVDYVISSKQVI